MSSLPSPRIKVAIYFFSIALAGLVATLVPTPNDTNGGTAKLVLIIFLTVLFKIILEFIWAKCRKKKDALPPTIPPPDF